MEHALSDVTALEPQNVGNDRDTNFQGLAGFASFRMIVERY